MSKFIQVCEGIKVPKLESELNKLNEKKDALKNDSTDKLNEKTKDPEQDLDEQNADGQNADEQDSEEQDADLEGESEDDADIEGENDESEFELIPIFASSFMTITASGEFLQTLVYDYYEKTGKYHKKIQTDRDFFLNEINDITQNMQGFMDKCQNKVNGKSVYPKVIESDIDFKNNTIPYFSWIIKFRADLQSGLNVYESKIDEEELEYDISSIYLFEESLTPETVETMLHNEISKEKHMVKYWGNRGELVGPKDILRFKKQ
jgi:hypothetical protein